MLDETTCNVLFRPQVPVSVPVPVPLPVREGGSWSEQYEVSHATTRHKNYWPPGVVPSNLTISSRSPNAFAVGKTIQWTALASPPASDPLHLSASLSVITACSRILSVDASLLVTPQPPINIPRRSLVLVHSSMTRNSMNSLSKVADLLDCRLVHYPCA